MKVVKFTVPERSLRSDFIENYGDSALAPCPILKEGQAFCATSTHPRGVCDAAWRR